MDPSDAGWEALEHTADVGVRAWAPDLPGLFEWTARGLLETIGVWAPDDQIAGEAPIEAAGRDLPGVLVDWLAEVLYLQDTQDLAVGRIEVELVDESKARGRLSVSPRIRDPEGIQVKAVTYHRIKVEQSGGVWKAEVYLDV